MGVIILAIPKCSRARHGGNPVSNGTVFVSPPGLLLASERRPPPTTRSHPMTDRDPFAAAPPELRELLALASDLALQAGRIHDEGRRQVLTIETKSSPTDLVSQVDKAAERLIVDRLRAERPDDALLAEEGSRLEGTSGRALGRRPARRHHQLRLRLPRVRASRSRWRSTGDVRSASSSTRAPARLYRAVAGHGRRLRRPADPRARARATWLTRARRDRLLVRRRRSASARGRGGRGAAAHPRHPPRRVGGARPLPRRRRRGGRLLGARPLAVGLRGRRADRPRGRRRRGARWRRRTAAGRAVVGRAPGAHAGVLALLARPAR